jgi:hypothetical protein
MAYQSNKRQAIINIAKYVLKKYIKSKKINGNVRSEIKEEKRNN